MKYVTLISERVSQKVILGVLVGLLAISAGVLLVLNGSLSTLISANQAAPQNVEVTSTNETTAQVRWTTERPSIARIEYGTSSDGSDFQSFEVTPLESTSHTIDLDNLLPGTTYYYRILIGDETYDNGGLFWQFTTPEGVAYQDGDQQELIATPSATITQEVISATPTSTITVSTTATPSATISPSPTNLCQSNNCVSIYLSLGTQCSTADYLRCTRANNFLETQPTATPSATLSPTITPTPKQFISTELRVKCTPPYLQPNSCTNWHVPDVNIVGSKCSDIFTQYNVQCRSTSFTSTDTPTWYCNELKSSPNFTLPCGAAPTPIPGQQIFCRVRAETEEGGWLNATSWAYSSSSCAKTTSDISACEISFFQTYNGTSWYWDFNNQKDPRCTEAFSHYFFQCTNNGDFSGTVNIPTPTPTAFWYCNTTTTADNFDLPCGNMPAPENGQAITCRVRAEDAYGINNHYTSWVTVNAVAPTFTPTPSPTATPTNTPTPTPTP